MDPRGIYDVASAKPITAELRVTRAEVERLFDGDERVPRDVFLERVALVLGAAVARACSGQVVGVMLVDWVSVPERSRVCLLN